MILLVSYQITYQNGNGDITHSVAGFAFCKGEGGQIDTESFSDTVAMRHKREGDTRVAFSIEVVRECESNTPHKGSSQRKRRPKV